MAFGTRQFATFVAAPLKNLTIPLKGSVQQRELANGQMTMSRSRHFRKHFDFVYKGTQTQLASIKDFIEESYGGGPFLFNMPNALTGNMLPRTWSKPALALGARGNQSLDFYSQGFTFGSPVNATLTNPHEAALAITGLAGAPTTGARLWSPSSTAPAAVPNYTTRPFTSLLVPPFYSPRISVWGQQNNVNSPGLYYSVSNIPAATVATGTKINPTLAGASVFIPTTGFWRVLDLWIGAGSATTATEFTNFGAIDVRMQQDYPPGKPDTFGLGRGQFPCKFSEGNVGMTLVKAGVDDDNSLWELDGAMEEVSAPW
jgi:hypothetical protein